MINIFLLQWQRLRRKPFMVISMLAMTTLFVIFIGGISNQAETPISAYFSNVFSDEEKQDIINELNELEGFSFTETKKEKAKEQVALGITSFAIYLDQSSYTFLVGTEDPNQAILDQYLQSMYREEIRIQDLVTATGDEAMRQKVEKSLENPLIEVESHVGKVEGDIFLFDNKLQALFGMTLFFAIYTIVFSLSEVAEEKQRGSWDRLILSPLRKWQIYLGYLNFAFFIGIVQIVLVFLAFQWFFQFHLGDNWLGILAICCVYTFAIVSLGMLLIGLVNKSSQLNAIVPIVAVSMAMLGGAYWPIEIVDNPIVLALSKVIPMTHAMDALKSITIYGKDIADITQPLSILFLMGVLCMGIGINLMERR